LKNQSVYWETLIWKGKIIFNCLTLEVPCYPKRRRMFTRTRRNIPEDLNRHLHRLDNLKSRNARLLSSSYLKASIARNDTCLFHHLLRTMAAFYTLLLILRFRLCCLKSHKPLSGFSRVQMTCRRFGKRCSYHVRGDTDLVAGDVWEGNQSAHLTTLHPPPHLHKGKPRLTHLVYPVDGIFNSYRNVRKSFLYNAQPWKPFGHLHLRLLRLSP
jgi:hypothetical protein